MSPPTSTTKSREQEISEAIEIIQTLDWNSPSLTDDDADRLHEAEGLLMGSLNDIKIDLNIAHNVKQTQMILLNKVNDGWQTLEGDLKLIQALFQMGYPIAVGDKGKRTN